MRDPRDRRPLQCRPKCALAWCGLLLWLTACSETTFSAGGQAAPDAVGPQDRDFDPQPQTVEPFEYPEASGVPPGGIAFRPQALRVVGASPGASAPLWLPDPRDFVLRDVETGSLWNLRGQAFDGELQGAQLGQIAAHTVFWFSWSASHDGGQVWQREELNRSGAIEPDGSGECNVPCGEIRSGGPPPDGIPTLDHRGRWGRPTSARMVDVGDSDAGYLRDASMVLGVYLDGEAHAYPQALLNWHENYIDLVGETEINMTYCPLTGSGIGIPVEQSGGPLYLFVSGRLFNDNLTMWEREVDEPSFWNQVLLRAVRGPRRGDLLETLPVTETTWGRWRQMHPSTKVASAETGYERNYGHNPYCREQSPQAEPLFAVRPNWARTYANKSKVLALDGPVTSRAYAFEEMEKLADRVVINDELDGEPILVLYEAEHRLALPFSRTLDGRTLRFEGVVAH